MSKAAVRSRSTSALVSFVLNPCGQLKQLFLWNETNDKQIDGEAIACAAMLEQGPVRQCFEGETPMIFEISSADTGLNPDRVVICLG